MTTFEMPANLLHLLYIRQAWRLDVLPEIPTLAPVPELGQSDRPTMANPERAWLSIWQEALAQKAKDPALFYDWRALYRIAGTDRAAFTTWSIAVREGCQRNLLAMNNIVKDGIMRARSKDVADRGIETVLLLPLAEHFAQRPFATLLVVAEKTVAQTSLWRAALH